MDNISVSFKDFLKKHSNIDKKFIDDFSTIFENIYGLAGTKDVSDFVIDLNVLSSWLDIKKMQKKVERRILIIYMLT